MNTKDFQPEIFKLFDDQWGILTAGDKDAFNSMTISWGMLGTLWCMPHKGKNVCAVFVNPARYTYGFMEKSDYYTVSFFDNKKYQKALGIMGSKSGRDMDKAKASGLTPKYLEHGVTYEEAELLLSSGKSTAMSFSWGKCQRMSSRDSIPKAVCRTRCISEKSSRPSGKSRPSTL